MKIYQNLSKFANLDDIGKLNFLVTQKTFLRVTWPVKVKSWKEEKTKNGVARCHTVAIKYIIFIILSWFLAWIWPEWLTPIFI